MEEKEGDDIRKEVENKILSDFKNQSQENFIKKMNFIKFEDCNLLENYVKNSLC